MSGSTVRRGLVAAVVLLAGCTSAPVLEPLRARELLVAVPSPAAPSLAVVVLPVRRLGSDETYDPTKTLFLLPPAHAFPSPLVVDVATTTGRGELTVLPPVGPPSAGTPLSPPLAFTTGGSWLVSEPGAREGVRVTTAKKGLVFALDRDGKALGAPKAVEEGEVWFWFGPERGRGTLIGVRAVGN